MSATDSHVFYLAPAGPAAGLTSVALGLLRALDRRGLPVHFVKPIAQFSASAGDADPSVHFAASTGRPAPEPIPLAEAEQLIGSGRQGELLERVVALVDRALPRPGRSILLVEGLKPTESAPFADDLNARIATALDARVVLVTRFVPGPLLGAQLDAAEQLFGPRRASRVAGCIVNALPAEAPATTPAAAAAWLQTQQAGFDPDALTLLGAIPLNEELRAPRTADVARHLEATVLQEGALAQRRVRRIAVCARTVRNLLSVLTPGTLVVTPSDRDDVCLAASLTELNHVPLAGIVLTGETEVDPRVIQLCQPAFDSGLPLLKVTSGTYETATQLHNLPSEVPPDDLDRIEGVMDFVARHLDLDWFEQRCQLQSERRLSPAAFRHQLVQRAREAAQRIVLPEGDEPRTLRAAETCARRGIARCILLGDPDQVRRVAAGQGVSLDGLDIIDPNAVRERYVDPLVQLRRSKKMEPIQAREALLDNVMLGTVMLALDEVDGLVSGAVHSTANTIRPALQIIKCRPGAHLVSSIFFMCLPEQVVVYGDCAVNPDPDAEALADIAIQSADSAHAFGIPPRVAMISYSTGESGSGADVDKVREATRLARERRPDLLIDGPLQYDAAAIPDVARTKAPDSPVAGRATVYVFPDLNTGNTTYKAVQRSANVISIGPMLQGLKKPVNDLSRGALVEDIIYTIALTAIQAAATRA